MLFRGDYRSTPCPANGRSSGACPGYVVDHKVPLKRGGPDSPANMQWQTIGIPPEDAQFLQTRAFQIGEVARWFNIPVSKLRDSGGANYASLEQENMAFLAETLRPWLIRWEQEISAKLVKRGHNDWKRVQSSTTHSMGFGLVKFAFCPRGASAVSSKRGRRGACRAEPCCAGPCGRARPGGRFGGRCIAPMMRRARQNENLAVFRPHPLTGNHQCG